MSAWQMLSVRGGQSGCPDSPNAGRKREKIGSARSALFPTARVLAAPKGANSTVNDRHLKPLA
jgi:hypothetical protein